MSSLDFAPRRWIAGIVFGLLMSSPAIAATYRIGLFENGTTPAGSGEFTFTNPGTTGGTPANVSLNIDSASGAQTLNGSIGVQVAAVSFNDGKTNAEFGANTITGNFVEGLRGSVQTDPAVAGLSLGNTTCPTGSTCFYRLTFSFTPAPLGTNPNNASKTYVLSLEQTTTGPTTGTPPPIASVSGTYSVSNTLTIPEPGSLVLIALSLAALGWFRRQKPAPISR